MIASFMSSWLTLVHTNPITLLYVLQMYKLLLVELLAHALTL